MFVETLYLVHNPDAPNASNDPLLAKLTGGEYEEWRRIRFDISEVEAIEEEPLEDRCYIRFYNGVGSILKVPYDEMRLMHNSYFQTLQDIQDALRESRGRRDQEITFWGGLDGGDA